MKKIIKLAIVLLSTFSLSLSAYAGELTVTGTAKATYDIQSSDSQAAVNELGKGLGITNELTFGASGELDNGFTWTYSMALDPGEVDGGTSADNDDTSMTIGTPYGTIGLHISAASINKQLAFSSAAYTTGIDLGVGAINDPVGLSAYNSIQYTSPAGLIPFGTTFQIGYAPSADTGAASSGNSTGAGEAAACVVTAGACFTPSLSGVTEYGLVTKPIDGLTVSASYVDTDSRHSNSRSQAYEAGVVNAKYAYGPVTVGFGRTLIQPYILGTGTNPGTDRVLYQTTDDWSVGYAVNENLSVSFEKSSSVQKMKQTSRANPVDTKSNDTQDSQTIQAAYTMGGMTFAISQASVDGDGYTKEAAATARVDVKETIFAITMAF